MLLHSDDITASPCKLWETKGGCPSLGCPCLSPFYCLNAVLHQLVHSILIDHEGWMKVPSLHQLFKTLTLRTDWLFLRTSETEQDLDFPFHIVCSASLPPHHRRPAVKSHTWSAGLYRPSGCVVKGTKFREDQNRGETEWVILSGKGREL